MSAKSGLARATAIQMARQYSGPHRVWLGGSLVIGYCVVCGRQAEAIAVEDILGRVAFYCKEHYQDLCNGTTEYHELVQLVRRATGD